MGRSLERLRKLRLSLLLPPMQLILAYILWSWPVEVPKGLDTLYSSTPWLIARGISGPAIPLGRLMFFYWAGLPSLYVLGLGPEEICFFGGVLVFWFVVGRELDNFRRDRVPHQGRSSWGRKTLGLLSGLCGVLMLIAGLESLHYDYNNHRGSVVQRVLFLVWSVVLIAFPLVGVSNEIRWKRRHSAEPRPSESKL